MFKTEWTKQHTQILLYTCVTILIAVVLVLAILFPETVFGLLSGFLSAVRPMLIGFVIAYLLHPVCRFFEKKVLKGLQKKKARPFAVRSLAVLLTFLCAAGVIALFIGMVVPQLKASYLDLNAKLDGYVQKVNAVVERLVTDVF